MEIVDLLDARDLLQLVLELMDGDADRDSLHENTHAVFDNGDSGENDEDRKDEGADRVCKLEAVVAEDDDRSDNHSNALNRVP